jgi:stalled ribosome rescue protein Dom34
MSERLNAVVWIDHREAKVMLLGPIEDSRLVIHSHLSVQRAHHQSGRGGGSGETVDAEFFKRIVTALHQGGITLVSGPGNAGTELQAYIAKHRPDLAVHLLDVGVPDRSDEARLLVLARDWLQRAA